MCVDMTSPSHRPIVDTSVWGTFRLTDHMVLHRESSWLESGRIQNLDFTNIPILEERFQADGILRNQRKPVHGLGPQTPIGNKNVMCIN